MLGIRDCLYMRLLTKLIAPYQSIGYSLCIDNWYSSFTHFEKLLEADTNVVGTIRLNRKKNIPEELKKRKLEKGDGIAMYSHTMMTVSGKTKNLFPL
jgi:hypothetical protein